MSVLKRSLEWLKNENHFNHTSHRPHPFGRSHQISCHLFHLMSTELRDLAVHSVFLTEVYFSSLVSSLVSLVVSLGWTKCSQTMSSSVPSMLFEMQHFLKAFTMICGSSSDQASTIHWQMSCSSTFLTRPVAVKVCSSEPYQSFHFSCNITSLVCWSRRLEVAALTSFPKRLLLDVACSCHGRVLS